MLVEPSANHPSVQAQSLGRPGSGVDDAPTRAAKSAADAERDISQPQLETVGAVTFDKGGNVDSEQAGQRLNVRA